MRSRLHNTLGMLHHKLLAIGVYWEESKQKSQRKTFFRLEVMRERKPHFHFEELWEILPPLSYY